MRWRPTVEATRECEEHRLRYLSRHGLILRDAGPTRSHEGRAARGTVATDGPIGGATGRLRIGRAA